MHPPFIKFCSGNCDEGCICFHASLHKIILNLDGHEAVSSLWKGTAVCNIFYNVVVTISSELLLLLSESLLTDDCLLISTLTGVLCTVAIDLKTKSFCLHCSKSSGSFWEIIFLGVIIHLITIPCSRCTDAFKGIVTAFPEYNVRFWKTGRFETIPNQKNTLWSYLVLHQNYFCSVQCHMLDKSMVLCLKLLRMLQILRR